MRRRDFLSLSAAGICAAAFGPAKAAAFSASARRPPNIIVVLADDMGYSDLGCFGGEIATPNIDRLAAGGIRFNHFYNAARCSPTRASLMTGLYSHQVGIGRLVYRNDGPGYLGYLADGCVTVAEMLKETGYQTFMSGKWHIGNDKGAWPTDRGFDRFYGIHEHVDSYFRVLPCCPVWMDEEIVIEGTDDPNDLPPSDLEWYTTDVFVDQALRFVDEALQHPEKPFFLYLAHNAPHFPLEAPESNIDKYRGKYMDGWDLLRQEKHRRMIELGILAPSTRLSPSAAPPWDELSERDKHELDFRRAIYAAQIDRMDDNMGRLMDHLEATGTMEDTLILFISDNGSSAEVGMFGMNWGEYTIENYADWRTVSGWSVSQGEAWANASNAPFRLYKKWVHEGGIATPLIAHWPAGITAPGIIDPHVGHVIDVLPTCMEIASGTYPAFRHGRTIPPLEGKSLASAFEGRVPEGHDFLFWDHEKHAAVRAEQWKLVTVDASQNSWDLHNLTSDPTELDNLAGAEPERVSHLIEKWTEWAKRINVLPYPDERNQHNK